MEVDLKPDSWIKLNNNNTLLNHIPEIDASIAYDVFFECYLKKNQACLIKNISSNWFASKTWVLESSGLNYDYLYKKYGSSDVMVYNCNEKYYNSQKTENLSFDKYLVYLQSYKKSGYSKSYPLLYLKDWHLKNSYPDDNFYEVPLIFLSDWLNEYLIENNKDDYRFVYIGPKGSWTPFHADVFKSYSWSVNVHGKKRWVLLPPGEEEKLKDSLNNLPYNIDELKSQVKYFEVIQNSGDGIFVPSNWYHQVWNLEDTISVNHNWFNGCNIKNVWCDLENNLKEAKKEIDDCKDSDDFIELSQKLLQACYGLDFIGFYDILKFIAEKRLLWLGEENDFILYNNIYVGCNQIMFDVHAVIEVLKMFINHVDVAHIFNKYDGITPDILLQKLLSVENKE